MIVLPTTKIAALTKDPEMILIYSQPKVGKTSLATTLPNCLIVDLEGSSDYFDGMFVDVKKIAKKEKISTLDAYKEIIKSLKKQMIDNGGEPVYDFIVLDSTSALEDLAVELANIRYRELPMGKGFTGNVLNLPNGAGYGHLREAFELLYQYLKGFYKKGLILLSHVRSSSINKNGQDLSCTDVALSGKLKQIITSQMDAIGMLYRNKGTNENYLSFMTNERDLASGARPSHLRGKEFLISKMLPSGELESYWENVYLDLKK
jgi:hypothetical protein